MQTPQPDTPNTRVFNEQMRTYYVRLYTIFPGDDVVATVYEDGCFSIRDGFTHGTFTSLPVKLGGHFVGRLGTRQLAAEVDRIPVGDARFFAIRQWRAKQVAEAQAAIDAALRTLPAAWAQAAWQEDDAERRVFDDAALARAVRELPWADWLKVNVDSEARE